MCQPGSKEHTCKVCKCGEKLPEACWACPKCEELGDGDEIGFECTELNVPVNEHDGSIRDDCPLKEAA